jgi:hypothetical protein
MPAKLANEPNLYLTSGVQSNSFIAAFLAKGSGLVNFSGAYVLGPDGANGARIEALMRRYAPHVRVLWRATKSQAADLPPGYRFPVDDALRRFSLRVDSSDCVRIVVHGLPPEPEIKLESSPRAGPVNAAGAQLNTGDLISCRIVPDDADHSKEIAEGRAVDMAFDRIEDACPALFQPRRLRTERDLDEWHRIYVNTDIVLFSSRGMIKFINPSHTGQPVYLGPQSDWVNQPPRLECGRRDQRYFAKVLNTQPH